MLQGMCCRSWCTELLQNQGYKSPFVCPLGKEKEANKARVELSQGSKSDLVALVNAYEGWKVERASFAWRYYLSKETMDLSPWLEAFYIFFAIFFTIFVHACAHDALQPRHW